VPQAVGYLGHDGRDADIVTEAAHNPSPTCENIRVALNFDCPSNKRLPGWHIREPRAFITDVHSVGLAKAQGVLITTSFYWDRTEESRQWSRRFFESRGAMPTQAQPNGRLVD
jgi:branched-chain amino acid transport system substrate-binding protein